MTYQDYVESVLQTVAKNLNPAKNYITTAALGGLLLRDFPGVSWKTFGKRTLSAFIEDLERVGKLTLIKTDKDALAVTLGDATYPPAMTAVEKPSSLRRAIWDAFVLLSPSGKRFMHRKDGTVRVALEVAPVPAEDWIEISPIDLDSQKKWASDFLAQNPTDGKDFSDLSVNENWQPQTFIQQLRQADEASARAWNKLRTVKVTSVVQNWMTQNSLPHDLVFQTDTKSSDIKSVTEYAIENPGPRNQDDLRKVILTALSLLPIEKLVEIPIPAGVMLTALSNAKLR
ncbi:hypothetical protein [Diaphorobacter aerolatus]|uniref:Uncharacterized protein n=1 Tax=Diaphorobacter aerolatus TaxID=1288495 RepID=A0A7H0GM71_9BURK|nr:hypothetical protein [Diaphorobacter aerolatus]QNP49387.1 hypothetical protein H9K75_04905 [Diaphorobacter aerolatus]